MLIIAHRGASLEAPENTLEAVTLAASCGADWAEVDLRLDASGTPVLSHDPFDEPHTLPTLEQLLALNLPIGLMLELKEAMPLPPLPTTCVVGSLDPTIVADLPPDLPLGQRLGIAESQADFETYLEMNLPLVALSDALATPENLSRVPCWVWTVDDPARAHTLKKNSARGIITNDPRTLHREFCC